MDINQLIQQLFGDQGGRSVVLVIKMDKNQQPILHLNINQLIRQFIFNKKSVRCHMTLLLFISLFIRINLKKYLIKSVCKDCLGPRLNSRFGRVYYNKNKQNVTSN